MPKRSPCSKPSPRLLPIGLLASLSISALANPVGDDFQVNQLTIGSQSQPDLAATPDGGFVVVWQSSVSPGDDDDLAIVTRRLDGDAQPVGEDLQVNTSTTFDQRAPRVASRGDGSFVVQWASTAVGGKGLLDSVQARSFDSAGSATGPDFEVFAAANIYTYVDSHDVGAAGNGDFVVAASDWYYNFGTFGRITASRLDASGTLLGQSTVDSSSDDRYRARVAGDENGFVVTWNQTTYGLGSGRAKARRLDGGGSLDGPAIEAHTGVTPLYGGSEAAAALTPAGDFLVVWDGYDFDTEIDSEIRGLRIDAMDVPDTAGAQILNTHTPSAQRAPRVARGADGTFLVVWASDDAPGDQGMGIRGRYLASDGSRLDDEFQINTLTTGDQESPEVETASDGKSFLVVWQTAASGDDAFGLGIRARRVGLRGGVFADGFESGDTSAW